MPRKLSDTRIRILRRTLVRVWDNGDGPRGLLWRIRNRPWFPYPLRSARIGLEIVPFGFWWRPDFTYRRALSEEARRDGETIWWARWAWFQISYGRWV